MKLIPHRTEANTTPALLLTNTPTHINPPNHRPTKYQYIVVLAGVGGMRRRLKICMRPWICKLALAAAPILLELLLELLLGLVLRLLLGGLLGLLPGLMYSLCVH